MTFTVYGTPKPQGSMKQIRHRHSGLVVSMPDNVKTKPWRHEVAHVAILQRPQCHQGAVSIGLRFYFLRPKSAPKSRSMPTVKPDIDKLCRAILDSLKGICWNDDAQVVHFQHLEKHYGSPERVEISVGAL